jgi:phage-related minor tail protein
MSTFSLNGRIGLNVSDLVSNADKARKSVSRVGEELDDVDGKTTAPTIRVDDKASADISRVDKDLAGLNGETANPTVKLDDKASAELDDVEKQLRKDIPDAANAGGKKASGNLSDSFADLKGAGGALLGGAIGTAIIGGLQLGMDKIQVRTRISQQFGLIESDAQRFGASAADIYADGWGEGTEEVLTSLARVNQRLVQTGVIGVEETERISKSALVLAEVFGVDVNEVIEATSKLMLNGLAPDADTALDLVATAMQGGGNAAGDLFESIDEYSVHFAAFGLSAEDMMKLFMDGMANGARDTDKLADAVKEMRIRAVDDTDLISDAYSSLGLDADAYRLQILAGGPSAKKAFDEIIAALLSVEDPIERNRLAIELMGTPIEDVGIDALESFGAMSEGVDGATGKVKEMTKAIEDAEPTFESLKRAGTVAFGEMTVSAALMVEEVVEDFEKLLGPWPDLIKDVGESADEVGFLGKAFDLAKTSTNSVTLGMKAFGVAADVVGGSTEDADEAVIGFVTRTNDLGKELVTTGSAAQRAALANNELEVSTDDAAQSLEDQREAAEELTDRINDLVDAHFDLVGGQMDAEEAAWDAEEATIAFAAALEEGEISADGSEQAARDYGRALNDATTAQLNAAAAAAESEIAQREANGEVLNAIEKTNIHKNALQAVADKLDGPVRAALDAHIKEIGEIPDEVLTSIGLDLPLADFVLLDQQLAAATAPRTVRISPHYTGGSSGPGGFSPSGFADGGRPPAGVPVMVGERGPEMVTFGPDAMIHTAAATAAFAASAGRGVSGPVTNNMVSNSTSGNTGGDVNVSVQIGQTELRDMITDVVISHDRQKEMIR